MGVVATVPINNFQGSQTSPAVAIPAGSTEVQVDFDGSTMLNPAVHVDTVIEFAPDGVTFRNIGGANFACGAKDRAGNPRAVYPVLSAIPPGGNPATQRLRGTLTVTGGSLTTVLHITAT